MNNTADIAKAIIPNIEEIKETVKSKTTVRITASPMSSGWGEVSKNIKADKLTYHNKPNIDDWLLKDLQWYIKNSYANKYGLSLSIPIAAGNDAINKIKFAMYKKSGKEAKHGIVKEYIDYVFDRYADEIIRTEGSLTVHKFTKAKMILEFMDRMPSVEVPHRPITVVKISDPPTGLTIDDLVASYRINPQYMVTEYGIIIPVNYLVMFKGKTLEDAIAYVQGAIVKLSTKSAQEMQSAIVSTNKFQPYPKWLLFTDVSKIVKMTISVCDDNPVFEMFKEKCK